MTKTNRSLANRLLSTIGEKVKGITQALTPQEAPQTPLREAAGFTVAESEDGWRKISGDTRRDLSSVTQSRMQQFATFLWESNLLANRIIELPIAYLLAEGVDIVANDEELKYWIKSFWQDPINQMDIKLISKVRQLSLFGEQCYPTYINDINGQVRMGYLDPSDIQEVVTDPDNPEQPILIISNRDKKGRYRKYRVIVNGDDAELFTQRTAAIRAAPDIDGEAFYFNINALSNGSRGRSDLLAQADWLDAYDQFLFGEIDRSAFLRAFVWDVTLMGATPEEVKSRARQITAPSPGSVRVHNDAEKWDAVSPDISAAASDAQARLLRNHILGGSTLPEHWYGGGGDVNRAVGAEMGDPTYKMFTMRQTYISYMLRQIITYQIRQRVLATTHVEPDLFEQKYEFSVQFPDMVARDVGKYATALQQVVVAASVLVTNELMSKETALQIIEKITSRIGVEFDAALELQKQLDEAATSATSDIYQEPPCATADSSEADDVAAAT